MSIELAPGAEDNGLASMMATMMSQNLADHPERGKAFERLDGRVAIVAEDADVALTMRFMRGRAVLYDGIVGIPDVTVRGSAEVIGNLSLMESGRFGLPDPKGEVNRAMVRALRSGELRIYGLPAGLPLFVGLGAVLAIE
ncbi:MAG: hypothetical protein AB7S26_37300 [Sandaracinaceae bacterium]